MRSKQRSQTIARAFIVSFILLLYNYLRDINMDFETADSLMRFSARGNGIS